MLGAAASAATVLVAVAAIWRQTFGRLLRWIWNGLKYLDPLRGIKANLIRQDRMLADIAKELKPNGGSSISDKVNAIWTRQGMTAARVGMLLDESDSLLWLSDVEGRQLWSSRALIEITERPAADLLGWGWVNVIHPDDRNRIRDVWVACLRDVRNFEEPCRFQTLHGTHYAGMLVAKPFFFDGKVISWIGRATVTGPAVKTNGETPKRPARTRR